AGDAACPDSCAGQTSTVSGSRLLPGARCRAGNRALDSWLICNCQFVICNLRTCNADAGFELQITNCQSQIAGLFFHEQNFLRVIDLAEFNLDNLIFGGLHGSADERSFNRQLAMTAIDQYAQLQAFG